MYWLSVLGPLTVDVVVDVHVVVVVAVVAVVAAVVDAEPLVGLSCF